MKILTVEILTVVSTCLSITAVVASVVVLAFRLDCDGLRLLGWGLLKGVEGGRGKVFLRGVLIRLLGFDTVGQMTTHIRKQLIVPERRSNFSTQQRKPAHNKNIHFTKVNSNLFILI